MGNSVGCVSGCSDVLFADDYQHLPDERGVFGGHPDDLQFVDPDFDSYNPKKGDGSRAGTSKVGSHPSGRSPKENPLAESTEFIPPPSGESQASRQVYVQDTTEDHQDALLLGSLFKFEITNDLPSFDQPSTPERKEKEINKSEVPPESPRTFDESINVSPKSCVSPMSPLKGPRKSVDTALRKLANNNDFCIPELEDLHVQAQGRNRYGTHV
jgi:hypothetical protein